MIPDDEIERVRDSADIVQIIGEHVKLKRQGTSYRGACPFHHGKDPNFSVQPGKGYKCFVCGESGSVYTFLQKHLGLDFVSAVRMVAEKSGLELREVDTRTEGPDPRERLWEIVGTAAAFFSESLKTDPKAKVAREYLASRSIDGGTIEKFGLGYAPADPAALRKHLENLGFDADRQVEAGLLARREGESELRVRFRDRLIFTIWDASGHPIGFGARSLDGREPKYLNSPESAVFSKGKTLYGLNWARNAIRRDERVLLVEGYFDAIRIMMAGIECVVAPLGTALTEEQARMVARYSNNVFLLYDSDKAGLKATFRAGDELLREKASVRVVTFPPGDDPDTFVAARGRDGLETQLNAAIDVFERKLQLLHRAGWFGDLHRRRRALDRLLPTIRAAADPLTRGLYITRAAEAAGIEPSAIEQQSHEAPIKPVAREERPPKPPIARRKASNRGAGDRRDAIPYIQAERAIVQLMVTNPGYIARITDAISPETFRDTRLRMIFETLAEHDAGMAHEDLAHLLDPDAVDELQALLNNTSGILDPSETLRGSLLQLHQRDMEGRLAALKAQLAEAPEDSKSDLLALITELQHERKELVDHSNDAPSR